MRRKNKKGTGFVVALLMSLVLAMPLSAKTADSTYVMPQHSAFIEVGGVTGLVGLNYDMRLRKGPHWGFRVGASYA